MNDEQGTENKEADAIGRPQEEAGQPLTPDSGAGEGGRETEGNERMAGTASQLMSFPFVGPEVTSGIDVVNIGAPLVVDLPSFDLPPIDVPAGVPLPKVAPPEVATFTGDREDGESYDEFTARRGGLSVSCSPEGYCTLHDCEH